MYNPSTWHHVSFQYPRCPVQKKRKNSCFAHFSAVFSHLAEASQVSRWDVILPSHPPAQTQNCEKKLAFLKIPPTGWDMGAFLRAFREKINKKCQCLGGGLKFREQNLAPWKFSAPLLDSNFNVDYDVVIKHGPIQSNDRVMNICAMSKSRWAPKITIIAWSRLVSEGGEQHIRCNFNV